MQNGRGEVRINRSLIFLFIFATLLVLFINKKEISTNVEKRKNENPRKKVDENTTSTKPKKLFMRFVIIPEFFTEFNSDQSYPLPVKAIIPNSL